MALVMKQGLIVRRVGYTFHRLISDELQGPRELTDMMNRIMAPAKSKKHFQTIPRLTGVPIIIQPGRHKFRLTSFRRLWNHFPDGDDDKNDKSVKEQREERLKYLQDLRKRTIEHNLENESVWKALKERDEIRGKDTRKNDEEQGKGDDK